MKDFTVKFSLADSGYMTALRLVAGAVCSVCEKDVDLAEDFKVCVTESVIILKNCGFEQAEVVFCNEEGFAVCRACGLGGKPAEGENELSLALISALVDGCDIKKHGKIIESVTIRI